MSSILSSRKSVNALQVKPTTSTSKEVSNYQNPEHSQFFNRRGYSVKLVTSALVAYSMISFQYKFHLFRGETLLRNFFEPQQAPKASPHLKPSLSDEDLTSRQLDIAVPLSGRQDSLVRLAKSLGHSISTDFGSPNTIKESWKPSVIRLLVTRCGSGDETSEELRKNIANPAVLPLESVVFVTMPPDVQFSRARALNYLLDRSCEGIRDKFRCVVAGMDVDMEIGSGLIKDYMETINSTDTAYFPKVFSQYNPVSIEMVQRFLRQNVTEERERGFWIKYGYGMFAVPGSALGVMRFDESITGWGGEDDDFHSKAQSSGMNVVRKRGVGLSHIWHEKNCVDGFVEEDRRSSCLLVKHENDGSHFARMLRAIGAEACGIDALSDYMNDQSIEPHTLYESMSTIDKFVEWSRQLESEFPRVFQKLRMCYQNGYKGDTAIVRGIGNVFDAKNRTVQK